MTIVAFGDSVTYGEHVTRDKTWPSLLGYVNKGVCADTTRLALERFPEDVQESGAERVLIQFGFNDCNRWTSDRLLPRVSVSAFSANLLEMVDRADRFGITPILVGTYRTCKNGHYEADRARYHNEIQVVANKRGVTFLNPEPLIGADLLLDTLHLGERGHQVFADLIGG